MSLRNWISGRVFHFVHGNNLVYNTCWEDPRLDRIALELSEQDRLLVITSAGCNALDYALGGAGQVHAVDMNPRQNALLELKLAAAKQLQQEDFFQLFGTGHLPKISHVYSQKLRQQLSPWSAQYWDRWIKLFDNPKRSFYFRGTSGRFARGINVYIDRVAGVRKELTELLESENLADQQQMFRKVRDKIWTGTLRFAMARDTTLSMLGVPQPQRQQIDRQYPGGIVKFVEDSLDAVFGELPIQDNYFWRVYITGRYTPTCCPEYLKPDNFVALQKLVAEQRIAVHTASVQSFLEQTDQPFTRFVLLDHMDWLSDRFFPLLESEWQAIVNRAAPGARLLWRSGGLQTDFLDQVRVMLDGQLRPLPDLLQYNQALAEQLHASDRVHTYGSFYIAQLAV
jgi:S-adenosylmethionine-diacylglycerol 3-amino-3-carboxypropyl transferase